MPSSLIIVALVVAWLVVLVPMMARKRQESARSVGEEYDAMPDAEYDDIHDIDDDYFDEEEYVERPFRRGRGPSPRARRLRCVHSRRSNLRRPPSPPRNPAGSARAGRASSRRGPNQSPRPR